MKKKQLTEQELLENLDAYGAHADELAKPLDSESGPLQRLQGSVQEFEHPTDPAADSVEWDVWFDGEGTSEDFMKGHSE